MFCELFLLFFLVFQINGVVYDVNETEYRKMPPLFKMDNYDECSLDRPGGYCVADFELFSKTQSQLMEFIKEYSSQKTKHFNHTQIHRAVCLSKCQKYYINNLNKETVPKKGLEACINQSIWNSYGIEAKLSKLHYCKYVGEIINFDAYDIAVAAIYAIIIVLNVIGSIYGLHRFQANRKTENEYLIAFSIQRNWARLTAPSGEVSDARMKRLKVFHGLRAMTMVCVIFSHSVLITTLTYVANPMYIEKAYDDLLKQFLFNGNLVTLTFLIMSSFLLAYNLQIFTEKHSLTWTHIPKAIFLRWFRLTPPYALVIATISTLMRHTGDGPLWQLIVTSESEVCRQYWWANVFYFNNYIYKHDICFPQGWYLAADTQLFCFGLILLVLVRSSRGRKVVLTVSFVLSLIITAAITYFEDLDAIVIQSPESYRSLYVGDKTFRLVYVTAHANVSVYCLGLAGGLLTYRWQNTNIDLTKYKKYRWLVWPVFPLGVAVILSGGLFYINEFTPSIAIKVIYATLYKPIFQGLVLILLILGIFKFESVYRGIMEWRGFTWAGRVTYSAYLVHTMFQRGYVGAQTTTFHLSDYNVLILFSASLFLSFGVGALLWLTVEAPLAALTRAMFTSNKNTK